jgi:phosphoribosyl 1,2-cyclic phosphodiesterase
MKIEFWGVRGSLATPSRDTLDYGGNTACVHVELPDAHLVLDAGTGIRPLGARLAADSADRRPIHILLTHLHLDHIQGLLFFAPLFDPAREVVISGPADHRADLERRLGQYLSAPLSPVEIHELPAQVRFDEHGRESWEVAGARISAEHILHRGPTLGLRVDADHGCFAYLPDHEPALSGDLAQTDLDLLSGSGLVAGVDLLIHDGQYTSDEYRVTRGWGHSTLPDAVTYAQRADVGRVVLFHHDPAHDDTMLDELEAAAQQQAGELHVCLAREGDVLQPGRD